MHGSSADFLAGISGFLGGYYLFLALVNAVVAFYLWHNKHKTTAAIIWAGIAFVLVAVASAAMGGSPPGLPHGLRDAVNWATGPVIYSVGTTAILLVIPEFLRIFYSNKWNAAELAACGEAARVLCLVGTLRALGFVNPT